MSSYRPELPDVPKRMKSLPIRRGYPVPWFVAMVNGDYHFPTADARKVYDAVNKRLCWVCGQPLGSYVAFVVGPMCAINRVTSEPACHCECATFAAQACPFLARPHMKRTKDIAEGATEPPGTVRWDNPGVSLVWVTRSYQHHQPRGGGLMFMVGPPITVHWYAKGMLCTREEAKAALWLSRCHLQKIAEEDSETACRDLAGMYADALTLLPPGKMNGVERHDEGEKNADAGNSCASA